jgi:hypothetical protein
MADNATMQLLGWAASRTAEAIVNRVADRANVPIEMFEQVAA